MSGTGVDLDGAERLVASGRQFVNLGDPGAGATAYRDALARLPAGGRDAAVLRARALLGLALATMDLAADVAAALDHLDAAEAAAPPGDDALQVALAGQRGIVLARAGRPDEALACFRAAERHLPGSPPEDRVLVLLNRGALLLELGRVAEARADADRAATEAAAAGLHRLAYKARHNAAYADFLEGDLPRAVAGMAAATRRTDGSDEPADPITLMDRGRVLLEAGLAREADELLVAAQEHFERDQRGRDLGEVMLVRAEAALVSDDLEEAAELARSAATDFAVADNAWWQRRAELVALGVEHRRRRMGRSAGEPSTSARPGRRERDVRADLDRLAAAEDPEVAAGARLLAVEQDADRGRSEAARARMARVVLPPSASVRLRLRWHAARAALAAADGDPPGVVAAMTAGVQDLAAAQARVGSRDLRTAMALHGRDLVDRGVGAALDGGDPGAVHHAVDLAHAASARLTPVRARLGDHERGLLAELRALEDRQWRTPDVPETVREAWDDRAAELRAALRRRSWRHHHDDAVVDDVVDLTTYRAALRDVGAAGVTWVPSDGNLRAVAVTDEDVRVCDLGPASVVLDLVDRLRADLRVLHLPGLARGMQGVVRASLADTLGRLDEGVLAPLEVDGRDLVVVPHGDLALVPWNLCASRRGAATTSSPSATTWVRRWARPPVAGSLAVAALAGPDLARARDECAAVAAQWGREGQGRTATIADLRGALSTCDVVHVAAHGVHRASSPLFSSVRLGDGAVFAHELVTAVHSSLVVLSACEVGEQAMRPGDEPLGLAAALLESGAGTVVGSVAPIRDDVAEAVGRELHVRLVAGATPARAVADTAVAAWDAGEVAPMTAIGHGMTSLVAAS